MDKKTRALQKQNNKNAKLLSKDSRAVFDDITVYLYTANVSFYNQAIVRRDVAQMLLEADERGEYARDVVGGDYRSFCDNIISELPELTSRERKLGFIGEIFTTIAALLVLWLAFYFINLFFGDRNWNQYLDVKFTDILFVLGVWAFEEVSFSKERFLNNGMRSVYISTLLLCVALFLGILDNAISSKVLFSVHVIAVAAIIAVLFAASMICENVLDKKSGS